MYKYLIYIQQPPTKSHEKRTQWARNRKTRADVASELGTQCHNGEVYYHVDDNVIFETSEELPQAVLDRFKYNGGGFFGYTDLSPIDYIFRPIMRSCERIEAEIITRKIRGNRIFPTD